MKTRKRQNGARLINVYRSAENSQIQHSPDICIVKTKGNIGKQIGVVNGTR